MPGSIGVVVIHGMGEQQPGYSEPLATEVAGRLGTLAARCVWQEIYWADLLDEREAALRRLMQGARDPAGDPIRLRWKALRTFLVHSLCDALAYHRDRSPGSVYHAVHARISEGLADLSRHLHDPAAPLVVLAHSLGGHMMSNYIWDRQHWNGPEADPCQPIPTLAAMVTFGCNIPLFALEFDVATPIDLPGPGITTPPLRAAAAWQNLLDVDDILGWPLRPLYARDAARLTRRQQDTVDRIQDQPVNVGGMVSGRTPKAHVGYWTDDNFTRPVAACLERIVAAVDG